MNIKIVIGFLLAAWILGWQSNRNGTWPHNVATRTFSRHYLLKVCFALTQCIKVLAMNPCLGPSALVWEDFIIAVFSVSLFCSESTPAASSHLCLLVGPTASFVQADLCDKSSIVSRLHCPVSVLLIFYFFFGSYQNKNSFVIYMRLSSAPIFFWLCIWKEFTAV